MFAEISIQSLKLYKHLIRIKTDGIFLELLRIFFESDFFENGFGANLTSLNMFLREFHSR